MQLGPIQKEWIRTLREHPERQTIQILGIKKEDGTYKVCCLGQLGLQTGVCRFDERNVLVVVGSPISQNYLDGESYKSGGLRDNRGRNIDDTQTLSHLNDSGKTWPEIADMLESNPDEWFTHSV